MAHPPEGAISSPTAGSVRATDPSRRVKRPSVRQSDVTRAIKGAKDAGVQIGRVEIEGGKIVLVAAGNPSDGGRNEWDEVLPL